MDNGDTQNFELDKLNLDTSGENWKGDSLESFDENQSEGIEHSQRALGNTAVTAPEINPDIIQGAVSQLPATPELGQITPSMPPGYTPSETTPELTPQVTEPQAFSFQRDKVMSSEHLSPQAVEILQDQEKKLSTDGDIAAFVDFIDDARDEFQGKEAA